MNDFRTFQEAYTKNVGAHVVEKHEDDMKVAKEISKEMFALAYKIQDIDAMIKNDMSSFNSPGLRTAFYDALIAGMTSWKDGKGFNIMSFDSILKKYLR